MHPVLRLLLPFTLITTLLVISCGGESDRALTRPLVSVADTPAVVTTNTAPQTTQAPVDPTIWAIAYCAYREERQLILQLNYDAFGSIAGSGLEQAKGRAAELYSRNQAVLQRFAERLARLSVPDGALTLHNAEVKLVGAVLATTDDLARSVAAAESLEDIEVANGKYNAIVLPFYVAMSEANKSLSDDVVAALRLIRNCGNDDLLPRLR